MELLEKAGSVDLVESALQLEGKEAPNVVLLEILDEIADW